MNEKINEKLLTLLADESASREEILNLLIEAKEVQASEEDIKAIHNTDRNLLSSSNAKELSFHLTDGKLELEEIEKLPKNLKKDLVQIPSREMARFLMDNYYRMQDFRIALDGQLRSFAQETDKQPKIQMTENNISFMVWQRNQVASLENSIKDALDAYSSTTKLAKYAREIKGIGPVLATCLSANLSILKDENGNDYMHAGHWWSYCGLNDNNHPWLGREKSKKIIDDAIAENGGILDDAAVYKIAAATNWRFSYLEKNGKNGKGKWDKETLVKACALTPYNKDLKVVCFKIGHSFRMLKNNPNSLYGRLLKEREAMENIKNERGDYKEQALEAAKHVGKTTNAYKYYSKGMLPPAHIMRRAERYAVKLFISHLFEAAWYIEHNEMAPKPYVLSFVEGHADYIEPEIPYSIIDSF